MKRHVSLLRVWAIGLASVLAGLAPVSASGQVPALTAVVTTPGGFTSLAPSRLLDTRVGMGAPRAAVPAGGTIHLQVTGQHGVPSSDVSAVVLNVTVTEPTGAGFVSVYGDETTRPGTSNLNFVAAQTVPNLVIASVGANGKVALYNRSDGTIQLIADISGYHLAGTPAMAGAFGSLAPSRLLDTRVGVGAPKAVVPAGGTLHLQVTGHGGVPLSGVSAVVLNVTVTAPTKPGVITVYGDQTTRPGTSNLNFVAGQSVPNLVIAQVGANGKVALYNGSAGTVHLIADVSGYYLAGTPTLEGTFGSLVPSRLLDTRTGLGAPKAAVAAGGTVHLQVAGIGGAPSSGVSAVVLNVTVTAPTKPGVITVYGDQTTRPGTSNLNFVAGQSVPNLVIAQVGANGKVALHNGSAGTVHLVADVSGWFRNTDAVPGLVTNVRAVPNSTSIALSWTNPTSASLTGVMIRRALGSTPPASPTEGTLVTDVATPAMSFTDTALLSGTPYSYALFAHNATPGYATAATVSSNTTAAGSGDVSGTVTDAGGTHHGLVNVIVGLYSPSHGGYGGVETAADGTYTVTGLPAGTDYQVCFYASYYATGGASDALGYVDQCYNNQPNNQSSTSQTPVTVTAGATTTGINAVLAVGGAVSGTVTDAGGTHHGLAHVGVTVISVSVSSPLGTMLAVETAADGSYSIAGLATGTDYKVCFDASGATGGSSDATGYVNQCYNNQPFVGTPTPVSVTAGAATTGINAVLAGRP
jgi:hypothetical protein